MFPRIYIALVRRQRQGCWDVYCIAAVGQMRPQRTIGHEHSSSTCRRALPRHDMTVTEGVWQRRLTVPVGVTPLDLLDLLLVLLLLEAHMIIVCNKYY